MESSLANPWVGTRPLLDDLISSLNQLLAQLLCDGLCTQLTQRISPYLLSGGDISHSFYPPTPCGMGRHFPFLHEDNEAQPTQMTCLSSTTWPRKPQVLCVYTINLCTPTFYTFSYKNRMPLHLYIEFLPNHVSGYWLTTVPEPIHRPLLTILTSRCFPFWRSLHFQYLICVTSALPLNSGPP